MLWIVLGIICSGLLVTLLILNTFYEIRISHFFAYKNRFSPELPNVELYGGRHKSAIIATEYPHSQPLQVPSIELNYQLNNHFPNQDILPLLTALQSLLPKRYFIFYGLNLGSLVSTHDTAALTRLQQYQVDFAIYDLKQQAWLGCVLFKSESAELSEQLKFKFVRATLSDIQLSVLLLPKLKSYKLAALKKRLVQQFELT